MELEGDLEAETKGKTDAQRAAKKWVCKRSLKIINELHMLR